MLPIIRTGRQQSVSARGVEFGVASLQGAPGVYISIATATSRTVAL